MAGAFDGDDIERRLMAVPVISGFIAAGACRQVAVFADGSRDGVFIGLAWAMLDHRGDPVPAGPVGASGPTPELAAVRAVRRVDPVVGLN